MSDNDNSDPIHYASQSVNQGGMANQQSGSRITVPTAGSYLVTACVSGEVQTHSHGDGIRIEINRDGSAYPSVDTYPIATTGSENGQEYSLTCNVVLNLDASDHLEVEITNIGETVAFELHFGYFCAYKLG